jgi:hypothetical protein
MSIYGNETWYSGEVTPNNFAAQPYYRSGKQAPASGLPDAFHGADMGLETPPAAGPFGNTENGESDLWVGVFGIIAIWFLGDRILKEKLK